MSTSEFQRALARLSQETLDAVDANRERIKSKHASSPTGASPPLTVVEPEARLADVSAVLAARRGADNPPLPWTLQDNAASVVVDDDARGARVIVSMPNNIATREAFVWPMATGTQQRFALRVLDSAATATDSQCAEPARRDGLLMQSDLPYCFAVGVVPRSTLTADGWVLGHPDCKGGCAAIWSTVPTEDDGAGGTEMHGVPWSQAGPERIVLAPVDAKTKNKMEAPLARGDRITLVLNAAGTFHVHLNDVLIWSMTNAIAPAPIGEKILLHWCVSMSNCGMAIALE